jgi:hypothetical protein
MKSARKIRRLFTESRVSVDPEADERIFRDALTAVEESGEIESTLWGAKGWRTIMKSRITRLAAAAAILIVVIPVAYHVAGQRAEEGPIPTKRPSPREGTGSAFGFPSTAQSIAYSDVIVRAKLLEMHDVGRWEVVKVIYGQAPPAKVINVIIPEGWDSFRDRYGKLGVERILFLKDVGSDRYVPHRVTGDDGVDDNEEAIMKVIESGEHLSAPELGSNW